MRCLLVIAALAWLGSAQDINAVQNRLDDFDMRLNRLTSDALKSLDGGQAMAANIRGGTVRANRLNFLLDNKFPRQCPDRFFQCGTSIQCVANMLVCDGSNDCSDGSDESSDTCAVSFKEGDSWRLVQMTGTGRRCFDPMVSGTFSVDRIERSNFFGSFLRIYYSFDITFSLKGGQRRRIYTGSGFYSNAANELRIDRGTTPTDDRVQFGDKGNFVYRIFRSGESLPCEVYFGIKN